MFIGFLVHIIMICSGMLCTFFKDVRNDREWIGYHPKKDSVLLVRIEQELAERNSTYKTEGSIISDQRKGRLLLYFKKQNSQPSLKTGDHIVIRNYLESIPSNHNPGGFDYQKYCALKQAYHQVFLTNGDYWKTGYNDATSIERLILFLQKNVLSSLRSYIPKNEAGLAEALLIGYKEDLDRDLLQRYSNTGVVHVIAISGLHLALVYLIIEKICSIFLKKKSRTKALVIIVSLWIFTLLAGASPSVVRSAAMFTIIVMGESFQKRSNILNSLFASAFLLLCFDPFWLWDLGFQLSYSAVLSLVLFAKHAYDLVYVRNKALDHLWQMCSVTLAAQLLTLPIILYHFRQFPVYFVFTNMICVPLSSIILMIEILLCSISAFDAMAQLTGKLTGWLIHLMNSSVDFFNDLPMSLIYPIRIDARQAWIMFSVILLFYFYKRFKIRPLLHASFAGIAVIMMLHLLWRREVSQQLLLIVYNAGRTRVVAFISGSRALLIADSSGLDQNSYKRFVEPTHALFGINEQVYIRYPVSNTLLKVNNKRILLVNKGNDRTDADIKIISKNCPPFSPLGKQQLIIDGSNGKKKIEAWKSIQQRVAGDYHFSSQDGAFVKSFN